MAKGRRWPIVEIFGPTIQGEGALCGQPTHFVRFGGCGYRCSWCDSMYAVDPSEVKKNRRMMTEWDIQKALLDLESLVPNVQWVTLSGGDPCLQKEMFPLRRRWKWAVETQGQFFPEWLDNLDQITFSPKPPSSGMVFDRRPLDVWYWTKGQYKQVALKVVVQHGNIRDLDFAIELALHYSTLPFYFQPMTDEPRWRTPKTFWNTYNWLCNRVMEQNVAGLRVGITAVLPQLHAIAFADGEATITKGFRVPMENRT